MQIRELAMVMGAVLAGCTVSPTQTVKDSPLPVVKPPAPNRLADDVRVEDPVLYVYALLTPEQTHLVQVFDDTRRTYLTFATGVPAGLLIFDEQGRSVPFVFGERSVIVNAVRLGLLLRTPTQRSYAQAPSSAAAVRVARIEAGGLPWLPEELAAARAEILQAQQRLTGVAVRLEALSRDPRSASLGELESEIEAIRTEIHGVDALLVRAHFASGSSLLVLSTEAKQALLAAAAQAARIRIRGGADNSGSLAGNKLLARERALSMQRLLLDGGIAAAKVQTSASPGVYIVSNSTPGGRAQNRRVEVLFESYRETQEPVEPRGAVLEPVVETELGHPGP